MPFSSIFRRKRRWPVHRAALDGPYPGLAGQMQRGRRRVKRQRNEAPKSAGCYHIEAPMSDIEASLECQEGPFTLGQSPNSSHMDRQSSDASTSTAGPLMPLPVMNLQCQESAIWGEYIRQVYIGNSHCPIDGWYQACRSATYTSL